MDGIILVDKPAGLTSHDVVAAVRRDLGGRKHAPKVGHAGTLDPFATGLLLVLVGRATRVQRHLMALPKRYRATARFGWTSTTQDPEGELTETGRMPPEPLELPTGVIRQTPPAYSAIKLGGRRAYALARAGETVEIPSREVTLHAFDRIGPREFDIRCSAGTYVRTLMADLGDAYCDSLRRTEIGPFCVSDASDTVIGLGEALGRFLPVWELDAPRARLAGFGTAIDGTGAPEGEIVLLSDADGPIALAEPREGGLHKPVVGFRA